MTATPTCIATALTAIKALEDIRGKLLHTDKLSATYLDAIIESAAELGDVSECRKCGEYFPDAQIDFGYCPDCDEKRGRAFDVHEARNEVFRDNVRGVK